MKFLNRKTLFTFVLVFAVSQNSLADTRYVTDLMEITMRTGKGVGHKIIAMLKSGEAVKVLEPAEDWTLVENSKGKQGWVLTRFLTDTEPRSSMLEKLQRKHDGLSEEVKSVKEENESVKAENAFLKTELETSKKTLEELTRTYETLRNESSEFIDFKDNEKEARSKMKELSLKAETLEKENSRLKTKQSIRWFVAGAGVLFVGYLIGMIGRRNRRRSSLLS